MTGQETYRIASATVDREERATRTFLFEGLPPVVEYQRDRYGAKPVDVMLHVDRVTLTWINGEFRTAKLEGRRLKQNGKPGAQHGYRHFGRRWFADSPDQIPGWLLDLVRLTPEPSMLEFQTQEDQRKRREAR